MNGTAIFLALADLVAFFAMLSIAWRLGLEYQRGTLTTRTLLVGGFLFAGILGLFFAGVQTARRGSAALMPDNKSHFEDWSEPRITGNAHLLTGYIISRLATWPTDYAIVEIGNPLTIRNEQSGNRFRVTIEQISGTE